MPQFLPGGETVIFTAMNDDGRAASHIDAVSLKTGERRTLVSGATVARFVPQGYLLYNQGYSLMAAPFDPVELKLTDAGVPVVERVFTNQYNVTASGSLVYIPRGSWDAWEEWNANQVIVDRKGSTQILPAPMRPYGTVGLSPDGNLLAVQIGDYRSASGSDIWLYDLSRETLTRLTSEGGGGPLCRPDGKRISYVSRRNGIRRLFLKNFDGSGPEQEILKGEISPASWSPDGKYLAYSELNQTSRSWDIWIYSMEDNKRLPFIQSPFNDTGARFSPDGSRLAFASEESGQTELYVQPFPGSGGRWQLSSHSGCCAQWSQNGRELFYIQDDGKYMVVDVATAPE